MAPAAAAGGTAVATAAPPLATGPGGHTQRLLTVVKSGSIQDVKATPAGQGARVAAPAGDRVRRRSGLHRVPVDLLDLRQRAAARPGQLEPDAEPVEGAVVLPRPAGAAHDVPPDGGRRDHPGHGPLRPDPRPLHRPQPEQQARGPQVRHLAVHDLPHVLGGARHDRLVLPGPRLQLRVPVEDRPVLRPLRNPTP